MRSLGAPLQLWLRRIQFGTGERVRLWKLLTGLLRAGVELENALTTTREINRLNRPAVAAICGDLLAALREDRFADEMTRYLPASEALLFRQFGGTDTVELFAAATRIAEANSAVRRMILAALAKPVVLLLLVVVILIVMGQQFYPVIADIAPPEAWDIGSRTMYAISGWMVGSPFEIAAYAVTTVVGYYLIRNHWVGAGRVTIDRIPPWSLYRLQCAAVFLQVVAQNALVGNDITPSFLAELARGTSRYQRTRILAIADHLRTAPLGQAALAAGHNFPDREVNLVLAAIGDRTGWARNFDAYVTHWMAEIEQTVKAVMAILNFLMLLVVSGLILQAASSIYGMIDVLDSAATQY